MNRTSDSAAQNTSRLIGFLCEKGAYTFFDLSSPAPRKLPRHFMALPVASINQVQTSEVVKAFLSGAAGVLLAGCEICREQNTCDGQFAAMAQELTHYGIEPERLRFVWISAGEENRFVHLVNDMAETLRQMPPLRLPAGIEQTISHCG